MNFENSPHVMNSFASTRPQTVAKHISIHGPSSSFKTLIFFNMLAVLTNFTVNPSNRPPTSLLTQFSQTNTNHPTKQTNHPTKQTNHPTKQT